MFILRQLLRLKIGTYSNEKTGLFGLRPGLRQTLLNSHRRRLEDKESSHCAIHEAKLKVLISCAVSAEQLSSYCTANLCLCFHIATQKCGFLMKWLK